VKIEGSYTIPGAPETVYSLLLDAAVLQGCIPGCRELIDSGDGRYEMKLKVVLAAISGDFAGHITIADPRPPSGYMIVVEGTGRPGFLKGQGTLDLSAAESGTLVAYSGDVETGGTIASVGQRLLDTTAKMMIRRFFEKLSGRSTEQLNRVE
jgi:carbon monoxide dehydrogenase subunit G